MKRRAWFYLLGGSALLALAGCGGGFFRGERAAWRHDAEVNCLQSGAVKVGVGVVQISPIEGPGICGADFPLKVAALGESPAMSYAGDLRPPGAIPNTSSMPQWPADQPRYAPPAPIQSAPIQGEHMRWVPGPPPAVAAPDVTAPAGQPMSIEPPGVERQAVPQYAPRVAPQYVPRTPPQYAPQAVAPRAAPLPDDIPDDAILPERRSAPRYPAQQPAYNAPVYQAPTQQPRNPPPLGPARGPMTTAAIMPAAVTPPATLACPLVSALDRWVSEGVQPAALHWFKSPVVEIKQISAYSCRSMVGAGTHHISEHAFGNALDIAGFVFADGRKIMVKDGWHGSPEEQGFLHDVQLYACETFTTVLAPGYNAAHYNHIHVDLMRRASGRRPCRPNAVPGEVVAAKVRAVYASKQRGPAYTGSIADTGLKDAKALLAIPGEDGEIDDGDEVTGSIPEPAPAPSIRASRKNAIRPEENSPPP